jgi:hypothetical protein
MIVPAAFLLLFALVGQVPALLAGAVFGAAGRLRGDNISFPDGLLRFMPMTRPLIVLLPLLVLTLTRGWRLRGGPMVTGVVVTLAWLGGEAGGIIATRSMYDHYFLALVPPIALLAGTAICHLVGAQPGPQPMRILAALALAMLGPFAPGQTGITASSDTVGAAAAARQLTILGVAPAAHILVVNRGLLVYLDSDRQPSSRYFHPQHLLCDFPAPDPDPLAVALSAGPDALVVANYGRRMVCERTDRWAEVVKAIGAGYCLAAHVVGTWDSFDIFLPRTSGASRCRS